MSTLARHWLLISIITLVALAIAILTVRFSGEEDSWICENGVWIAHGNPSLPQPTTSCVSSPATSSTSNTSATTSSASSSQSVATFTGYIVKELPGLPAKPHTWYLIYERPGRPAQELTLLFDANSVCVGVSASECPSAYVSRGMLANVHGVLEDTSLRVTKVEQAK